MVPLPDTLQVRTRNSILQLTRRWTSMRGKLTQNIGYYTLATALICFCVTGLYHSSPQSVDFEDEIERELVKQLSLDRPKVSLIDKTMRVQVYYCNLGNLLLYYYTIIIYYYNYILYYYANIQSYYYHYYYVLFIESEI